MAIPLHDNSKKNLTKALLKNEYIEAFVTSVRIEHEAGSIVKLALELQVPEINESQMSSLVAGNTSRIAIVKI